MSAEQLQQDPATHHEAGELFLAYLANTVEGIWRLETDCLIPISLPHAAQAELILRHGYVAESNDAYARMHGLASATEMQGRRLRDLLTRSEPHGSELVRTFVGAGYRLVEVDVCIGDATGHSRWYAITMTGIVVDGHLARAWGAQRDVSRRQQRLAEEWRATFDAIRDPVIVLDRHQRIVRANAAAAAFCGRAADVVVGQHCHALFHGTNAPVAVCPTVQALHRKQRVEAEIYNATKSAWLLISADPVLDEAGEVVQVVHTVRDITERKEAEATIDRQLRFERVISGISARLMQAPAEQVQPEIQAALRGIREVLEMDRTGLLEVGPDRASLKLREHSVAPGSRPPLPEQMDVAQGFPWIFDQVVRQGHCLFLSTVRKLPAEAALDRANCLAHGIRSLLAIPLSLSASVEYVITGVAVREEHDGLEDYILRLRLLGEIIVNALARQRAQQQVRESEAFNRTVLSSLQDHIAVLDRSGTILTVNEAWERFARQNGAPVSLAGCAAGINYLDVCRRAIAHGDVSAAPVLAGIEAVLSGSRPRFVWDYRCDAPEEARWFEAVVQQLNRPAGGAIVSHVNITNQRYAEVEAQKLRDQLAHVARVASLGELATSLAHELNQPLTAILSNAQAAQHYLARGRLDPAELQEILADIVADDQRAADIIRRVRGSLKKGSWQPQTLDLNRLVREVAQMVRSDVLLRQVTVVQDLAPGLPVVMGDPIQLQQVLLNLITNAMDAMGATATGERRLQIRTQLAPPRLVRVAVSDRGGGIQPERLTGIFAPFFTTKSAGLGVGLSICRSIVQAHQGEIRAANNPEGGATVWFTLPGVEGAAP